jgi:rubrerythrin
MKRVLFRLAIVSIALAAAAASPHEVRLALLNAVNSEREAVARYELFARRADEEGFPGAAALFRAQAQSERTHAERFARLLRAEGVPLPPERTFTTAVGTTSENLRTAASAERAERDGTYREAIAICNMHGAAEIAKVFDQTRDSEVEHANLCDAAARKLDPLTSPKTFYVCGACGYATDVKLPLCPACQKKEALETVE